MILFFLALHLFFQISLAGECRLYLSRHADRVAELGGQVVGKNYRAGTHYHRTLNDIR